MPPCPVSPCPPVSLSFNLLPGVKLVPVPRWPCLPFSGFAVLPFLGDAASTKPAHDDFGAVGFRGRARRAVGIPVGRRHDAGIFGARTRPGVAHSRHDLASFRRDARPRKPVDMACLGLVCSSLGRRGAVAIATAAKQLGDLQHQSGGTRGRAAKHVRTASLAVGAAGKSLDRRFEGAEEGRISGRWFERHEICFLALAIRGIGRGSRRTGGRTGRTIWPSIPVPTAARPAGSSPRPPPFSRS